MSAAPVITNYVDLALGSEYVRQDDRVSYYEKRGIGKVVPIPGAGGLGSGISHKIYRVPKSQLLTRNEVRKIEKNESNAILVAQSAERAAAAAVRQSEMNINAAGIIYTDEPMTKLDIDMPINLSELADKALQLAAKKKWDSLNKRNRRFHIIGSTGSNATKKIRYGYKRKEISVRPGFSGEEEVMINQNEVSVDDAIDALRMAFIEVERQKKLESAIKEAHDRMPKNSTGQVPRELAGSEPKEREKIIQEQIDRKMPKIEAVLAKLREGMVLGFAPPLAKVVPKEENLLRFNNLAGINFSAPGNPGAGSGAPSYRDPFDGLNSPPNTTDAAFAAAGIEIEPETVEKLSKNQRSALLFQLRGMNKSQHNAAINSFLINALRKGGKRATRKARKVKKTRKVKRT